MAATVDPAERVLVPLLLTLTGVTGLVDAASYLSFGHVFTANMTGNVVFLGFAIAGAPGLSIGRSCLALAAFAAGAVAGGRIAGHLGSEAKLRWAGAAFSIEAALLLAAALACVRLDAEVHSARITAAIALTGLSMGLRNAVVRKLALPDLTTTVLTLTITGFAADSALAGGDHPRSIRRSLAMVTMFAGAALGAWLLTFSVALPLAVSGVLSGACAIGAFGATDR